jgi:gas vesicle protein
MKNEEVQNTEDRSSTEIASDIRERRNRMDATLDELSNQFTVRSIVNSALDWWANRQVAMPGGGVAKSAYRNVAYQVKKHPVPAVLVATGVAWMIIDAASEDEGHEASARGDGDDRQAPGASKGGPHLLEKAETKLDQAKHAASEVAGAAKDKASAFADAASDVAGAAKEKASALGEAASGAAENLTRRAQDVYSQGRSTAVKVGHGVQQGYRSGAEQLEIAMRDYPLAVAMGFAAAGALFGVLLPRTRPEDKLMGEKSDELLDATKEKGQELLERGKAVTEHVAETAIGEARQQGLTPEAATEKTSEIAGKVGEIAHKVTEESKSAAKENLVPESLKDAKSSPDKGDQGQRPDQPSPTQS